MPASAGQRAAPSGAAAEARAALTAGRAQDAVRLADAALTRDGGNLPVTAVKIDALITLGHQHDALRAYDAYFKASGRDDLGLLAALARGELWQTANAERSSLAAEALEALAANGDTNARQALDQQAKATATDTAWFATDALARLGDPAALDAMIKRSAETQGSRRADALARLAKVGPTKSVTAEAFVRESLKTSDPMVQAAAADAAAALGLKSLAPDLQAALKLADPMARGPVNQALARLGDTAAAGRVRQTLASPAVTVRLRAATVLQAIGDRSSWEEAIRPALADADKLNGVLAAELLLPTDRKAAMSLLTPASVDPNPVIRAEVCRIMAADTKGNRAFLRAFLSDSLPAVRLVAARTLAAKPR